MKIESKKNINWTALLSFFAVIVVLVYYWIKTSYIFH